MHKLSEKLSNGNICVGDFLKKWYGTKPTFVTYGAIDFQTIKKYTTKNNSKENLTNKIIFFGRLEKETGIMKYAEALNILKKKNISLELDVYGEGSLKETVKMYKKENNLALNLNGFIMNIESVLNNYEYVFCSRYLSILESMAFKKPVFAEYNNAIKKDYLQMAPFAKYISISNNASEIAQTLENYLLERNKLNVEKAYDWVKTETWDKMANTYLKLWNTK
jgi:glycosyltransferase involved in cell wall biosynthesis